MAGRPTIEQLNMGRLVHALVVLAMVGVSVAQSDDGPLPPRLQVLGAVPLQSGPVRARPAPIGRLRRPPGRQQAYLPTPSRAEATPPPPPPPTIQTTLPPRPVAEEVEEYDDLEDATSTPPFLPSLPPQPPPSVRQQLRAGPDRPVQVQVSSPVGISIADIPVQSPGRPQFRQQPVARPAFRPEQRFPARPVELDTPVPVRPQVRRPQPIPVEDAPQVIARQQFRQPARPFPVEAQEDTFLSPQKKKKQPQSLNREQKQRTEIRARPAPVPVEPRQQEQQFVRPQQEQQFVRPQQKPAQPYSPYKNRERKPVAQVLNKYRDDNPDGSITWGYENDDGSFKEETIGVDCVVRGKYGYVDPDGNRREYTYSSGIPCDKTKEKEQEGDQGYIDYQNNAYILPNGQSVPIQATSKNKGRRPQAAQQQANYGK